VQPWLDPQRMSYGSSLVPGWTCPHAWWGFSHLRQQNLWLGCAEILIIFHSTRSGGHLHHKVLTLAITTLHKQFFFSLPQLGFKRVPRLLPFLHLLHLDLEAPGVNLWLRSNSNCVSRESPSRVVANQIVGISEDGGHPCHQLFAIW
jgi:hypothetical protein